MKNFITTLCLAVTVNIVQGQIKIGANPLAIVPGAQLQINGNTTVNPYDPNTFIFKEGKIGINNTNPLADIDISAHTLGYASIALKAPMPYGKRWILNSMADGSFLFWDSTSNIGRFSIGANGNIGIGTDNATSKLEVSGEIIATAIKGPSDKRFKKNIKPIVNALDNLVLLNGYSYEWRTEDFPQKNFKEGKDFGLIAQEVEKIFPEVVYTANDDIKSKSIDYTKLTSVLIESIKELKLEIDELKKIVKSIKK